METSKVLFWPSLSETMTSSLTSATADRVEAESEIKPEGKGLPSAPYGPRDGTSEKGKGKVEKQSETVQERESVGPYSIL